MAASWDKENHILYDLFINAEWALEGEILSKTGFDIGQLRGSLPKKFLTVAQNCGSNRILGLPAQLYKLISSSLNWQLALSSDGKLLAVLQDNCIEIRSFRDKFQSVIAKCAVNKDACPQWRKLAWCPDCSMLACSYSSGEIVGFDLAGEQLFFIEKASRPLPSDLSECVAGLVFVEHKQGSQWSAELLVIDYRGHLKNYLVSPTLGYQENHSFSFTNVLPHGITAVLYHSKYSMLIFGTLVDSKKTSTPEATGTHAASQFGLTAWRILSGYPHYNLIEDEGTQLIKIGSGILKKLRSFQPRGSRGGRQDGVLHMALSPEGTQLAAVHLSGTLSLWQVPSLRVKNMWSQDEQPSFQDPVEHADFLYSEPKHSTRDSTLVSLFDVNWWTEEALILSHSTGAVTVSSTDTSLQNLLGRSPEKCEPWSQVTAAHEGGFLILECENQIESLRSKLAVNSNDSDDDNDGSFKKEDDELESDDDEPTLMSKSRHFAKQMMFFLTESDRFHPPVKRPKILHRTYRLVCIKSTTPEELYARKIEHEEYGEALVLAQNYGLDSDLVYQKQWRKSRVSVASIHDYLTKVKNRLWVLNECVERVPEDYEATKQLLRYGLHGTDARVVEAVGNNKSQLPFILQTKGDDYYDEERKEKVKEVEDSLQFDSFNLQQQDICMYRVKLLQYLDRLSTYEVILGGVHVAHEEYCHNFFERFREMDIIQSAVEYAREGNAEAVAAIFTYHGKETLPHQLAILANFDETLPPSEYNFLLPEAGWNEHSVTQGMTEDAACKIACRSLTESSALHSYESDQGILDWEQKSWRETDWVESADCQKALSWDEGEDPAAFLYRENPELQQYRCDLTPEVVTKWYKNRACEMECLSKQVGNSLQLVKLGMERGIKNLEDLYDGLVTLEVLVYESCTDIYLSLKSFQNMTDLERLRMLLQKSTEETFIRDFKCWVLPFLHRLEKRKKKLQISLIHQYLTDIAKTDLTYVLKVFQNSTPEVTTWKKKLDSNFELPSSCNFFVQRNPDKRKFNIKEPIIADTAQLMKLALDCIYITKRFDQVDLAFSILECLPAGDEDVISDQIRELNTKVDQLEDYLCGCELLAKHGLHKPVSFILDTYTSEEEAKSLMVALTKVAAKRDLPLKESGWHELLNDMLFLTSKVYTCIDPSVCYEVYTTSLLHSGRRENILLAGQMIFKSSLEEDYPAEDDPVHGPHVKYARATELVLEAAKEYFNSSADLSDTVMDLARDCLNLLEGRPPALQEEYNLIAALALLDDFEVSILPLQVRLCEDKLSLIKQVLDSSIVAYKKSLKILRLASLLQICGSDEKSRHGRVLMLVAESAMKCSDYEFACKVCQDLISEEYAPVWIICRDLGKCEEFRDLKSRETLLAFALTHCTPDELEGLLKTRSLLETQVLYQELNHHMQNTDEGEEEFNGDRSMLTQPKALLSTVRNRQFWKSTMKWLRPLQQEETEVSDSDLINRDFETPLCQGFHPFYHSLMERNATRVKGEKLPYEQYIAEQMANKPLLFSHCLLRTQKLSESRSEGEIVEPTNEVTIQLVQSVLKADTTLALAYLLSLHEVDEVNMFFSSLQGSYFCLHMASYCFALHILTLLHTCLNAHQANVYKHPPSDIINHVMSQVTAGLHNDWPTECQMFAALLLQYHNQMIDFAQGQQLQDLGRGVDISRFAQDPEYKQETILGLAMVLEEEVFNTAISLAERYGISRWEMYMSHLECLLSDSNLSTKEIQERVNKLEIMTTLLHEPGQMAERMKDNVFPTMDGTKHARLIYYYMLMQGCEEQDETLKDVVDAQTHVRVLKKIKSAATGLDYKKLMSDDTPLEVLRPVLTSANVHLLAKLMTKIPLKDGSFMLPDSVFRAYTEKIFWEGERKTKHSELGQPVKWNHRYEACQKFLPRLTPSSIKEFIDSVTFSEKAVDTVPLENRLDVVNRALRFARQQDAALKKKGTMEAQNKSSSEENMSFEQVVAYLVLSCKHLESLADPLIYDLSERDEELGTSFAQQYALSCSDPDKISMLVSQMFLYGISLETIHEVVLLGARQQIQTARVGKTVKQALKMVLGSLSETSNSTDSLLRNQNPMSVLKTVIHTVSEHVKKGGSLTNQEDVLECLKPFCADVTVSSARKTAVLQLLEESFDLSGKDTFLLLFFQTDAIVSSTWNRKLSPEDIDSDTKRHQLFENLLDESPSLSQLLCLGTLLQIWPILAATELNEEPAANPWVQLMDKIIRCHGDGEHVIDMMKQLCSTTKLNVECCSHVYNLMLLKCCTLAALKFALVSNVEAMHHLALENMKCLQVNSDSCDDELLELLVSNGRTVEVAQTPFLSPLFTFVLDHPDGPMSHQSDDTAASQSGARVKLVASQLQNAGYWAEAGTLMLKYHGTHPALRTFDSALGTISRWLR